MLKLVQFSRSGLLGTFRPRCTIDGNFDFKQCSGSMCFCVDKKTGVKVPGTEVYMPDEPKCDGELILFKVMFIFSSLSRIMFLGRYCSRGLNTDLM